MLKVLRVGERLYVKSGYMTREEMVNVTLSKMHTIGRNHRELTKDFMDKELMTFEAGKTPVPTGV